MPTLSVSMFSAALLSVALLCGAPGVTAAQTVPAPAPATTAPAAVEAPRHESGAAPAATEPAAATPAEGHATPAPAAEGAEHGQPAAGAATDHATPAAAATEHGAEPHGAAQAGAQHGESAEHGEEHGESIWAFLARIANFVILVGALVYFLRGPLGNYLTSRSEQIRNDLVTAKSTTATATAQLAEIDAKLKALPAEIQTLKKRGAEEIAAEEARIKQAAEAERHRLLEQTRREIDLQVRLAKRELNDYAATLAVDLASDRIKQTVTDDDHQRLIDRYVGQVRSAHD